MWLNFIARASCLRNILFIYLYPWCVLKIIWLIRRCLAVRCEETGRRNPRPFDFDIYHTTIAKTYNAQFIKHFQTFSVQGELMWWANWQDKMSARIISYIFTICCIEVCPKKKKQVLNSPLWICIVLIPGKIYTTDCFRFAKVDQINQMDKNS